MYYTFNGNQYNDTPSERQELLEAIHDTLTDSAMNDEDNRRDTDDQTIQAVSDAVEMSFDGTNRQMPYWDNIMAIMQHAPYEIDVQRHDGEMEYTS